MSTSTLVFLSVRALHVLLAATWIGMVAFVQLFLAPALDDVGPSGAALMTAMGRRGLHARIAAAFQQSGLDPSRYLHTLPWLSQSSFLGLLRTADVYLDTIGFSGFNTLMHAVEAGLPCATYDGRFMRGRLGSGIMRQLRSPELIAATKAQYVDTAVRLASDGAYRNELRERMRSSEHLLYGDRAAVDALSAVLIES